MAKHISFPLVGQKSNTLEAFIRMASEGPLSSVNCLKAEEKCSHLFWKCEVTKKMLRNLMEEIGSERNSV